jgi:hypothetical protein
MKIRRKTRKRGGMVPRRVSSSGRASSSREPATYNETYSHLLALESPETGTGMNRALVSNMATGISTPISHNIATVTNSVAVSNAETQKSNNNNGLNIPTMTEDELLQQYTSVYEKMTSKEDAAESAALLKPHLKKIQNPIAIYIVADVNSRHDGYALWKDATLHAYIITRTNTHFVNSTFKGWPIDSFGKPAGVLQGYPIREEQSRAWGFTNYGKNINTLTYYTDYQFKKPLDSRLIHMFQSIVKSSGAIGQINTTTSSMPGCGTCTTGASVLGLGGLFMAVCRAL